jgi:hypothetical protein
MLVNQVKKMKTKRIKNQQRKQRKKKKNEYKKNNMMPMKKLNRITLINSTRVMISKLIKWINIFLDLPRMI